MNHKNYFIVVGCITGIVAIAHLIRALSYTRIVIDGSVLPLWPSWVAFLVAGCISYVSFKFASGK